nr:hypothetical protein [Tanacetum cinerariifolium]
MWGKLIRSIGFNVQQENLGDVFSSSGGFLRLTRAIAAPNEGNVLINVTNSPATPKSFASLVINEAATRKVNFRSLDSDKPINAQDEVKIPKASFGYSFEISVERKLNEDMVIAIPNVKDDGEVLHTVHVKLKKPIWQAVSKKNSASSSGAKKNSEVSRKVTSSTNPFDALNSIKNVMLGSNEGTSNLGNKVVQDVIEGKLVLLDDDGKPLKPSKSMLPSSSNVVSNKFDNLLLKVAVDEGNKSLYDQWQESHGKDPYNDDDFDDHGLTNAQMKFANAFDINLHGQFR